MKRNIHEWKLDLEEFLKPKDVTKFIMNRAPQPRGLSFKEELSILLKEGLEIINQEED